MLDVGDRVRMRVSTTIYNDAPGNPHDCDGTVTLVSATGRHGHRYYTVKWDNGYINSAYRWCRDIGRTPPDNTVVLCSTSYQSCADLDEEDKEIIKNKLNLLETALSN